jgi:hypothetical protein
MNACIRKLPSGIFFSFLAVFGFVYPAHASNVTINAPGVAPDDIPTSPAVMPGGVTKPTLENNIVERPIAEPKPGRPIDSRLDPNIQKVDPEQVIPFLQRRHSYPPQRVFKMND